MKSSTPSDSGSSLFSVLGKNGTGKVVKAANGIALGIALYEAGRSWRDRVRSGYEHTVSVPAEDDIYPEVHAWVLGKLSSKQQRSLVARTYLSNAVLETDEPRTGKLRLYYDGSRAVHVDIDGHKVRVNVEERDVIRNERGMTTSTLSKDRIIFSARNEPGRLAVLAFLKTLAVERHKDTANRFYIARPWGDWGVVEDLPHRSLDTIVLEAGQRERILADIESFLGAEERYERVGLPWHRGYLLHGPPGTGKTSLAKALGEHLGLDLYYVALSDVREDGHLTDLLRSMRPRSVLILEDIDIVHAAKSRDDSETAGLSLSALLQGLDGMITPHGMITFMTTNNMSVLDKALVRPGRADVVEELGYVSQDQAERLVEIMTGQALSAPLPKVGKLLTPASLIDPAKALLSDPSAAEDAIRKALS